MTKILVLLGFCLTIPLASVTSITAQAIKPELLVQTGHTGEVNVIALSPDGHILASGDDTGKLKFWNTATGQELRTLKTCDLELELTALAFSPDSRTLMSAGLCKDAQLWDVETGR